MSQKDVEKLNQQLKINLRTPPPFPPPSCPRCSSCNTKFCYYNNYSESQPRYFCKNCRRYWTHGGVVRNLPSTRKHGRTVSSSPTSQTSKPPPSAPLVPPPLPAASSIGATRSTVGCVTLGAPITDNTPAFGGGDSGLFNQMPLKISQGGELGNVNAAFGAVNAGGFGGRAPLPPDPLTPMLSNLSPLDDFHDFGFSFLPQPQLQLPPPPQPPTVWTSLNMAFNCTSPNNFLPMTRDLTAAANVVNINEWPELTDMHTYKPTSP